MFRCTSADGSTHRFAGVLPRLLAEDQVCQHCDNEAHRHQGSLLTRDYEFHLRLAAKALIGVGTGLTSTEATARARSTAGGGAYNDAIPNGSLAAEWMDVLAPVLLREHAVLAWPETVLLDNTTFVITTTALGTSSQGFAIVALYWYGQGAKRGSLLGLYAEHDDVGETYERAIRYVEQFGNDPVRTTLAWHPPAMVLTDGAGEVVRGVRLAWRASAGPGFGPGTGKPYAKRCEWHLPKNAKAALAKHLITGPKHPLRKRLDTAFLRPEGWEEFSLRASTFPHAAHWVKKNDKHVADQVARRAHLPQHHSIAAVEQIIQDVRQKVERRAFTFRNQSRMNLLLGLMRLHHLRVDELDHYTAVLREAARAAGGRIEYQRQGYCTGRMFDLRP